MVMATDYFISVYDSVSNQSAVNIGHKMLRCQSVFASNGPGSNIRIQRTASFSMDGGRRNDQARGMQLNEQPIDSFKELSETVVARVLMEWKRSGFYSAEEVDRAFSLHRRLSPHRLKIISVESVEDGRFPQLNLSRRENETSNFTSTQGALFSALRIFDSSPVMKSFSRRRTVPELSESDTKEIAEQVFPGFQLDEALKARGISRSQYTWSLGLGSVAGKQDSALLTLFAQAADLLDLHYNQRSFFNFGRKNYIENDDVDIVFYSSEKLVPYYQRTLDIDPLLDAQGFPVFMTKKEKRYYIFHIKGSDFLSKYFNLRFHQPLFGNANGLRNEEKIRDFYKSQLDIAYKKLPQDLYGISTIDEFFQEMENLIINYVQIQQGSGDKQGPIMDLLARFILLRNSLPDDIFSQTYSDATERRVLSLLQNLLGSHVPKEAGLSYFAMLEFLLRDPVQFLANRTYLHEMGEGEL